MSPDGGGSRSSCPVCTEDAFRPAFRWHVFGFERCRRCGFVRMAEPPSDADLAQFYFQDVDYGRDAIEEHQDNLKRFDGALSRLERHASPGAFLDVGCSIGSSLVAARERGWDPVGLELSAPMVRYGRETFGVEILPMPLEQAAFPKESFRAVHMHHTLEHLPAPDETLARIFELLEPGGVMAQALPNYGCLKRRIFGTSWSYGIHDVHLLYFTPKTLRRLAERIGFEVLEVRALSYRDDPRLVRDLIDRLGLMERFMRWQGGDGEFESERYLAFIQRNPLARFLSRWFWPGGLVTRLGLGEDLHLLARKPGARRHEPTRAPQLASPDENEAEAPPAGEDQAAILERTLAVVASGLEAVEEHEGRPLGRLADHLRLTLPEDTKAAFIGLRIRGVSADDPLTIALPTPHDPVEVQGDETLWLLVESEAGPLQLDFRGDTGRALLEDLELLDFVPRTRLDLERPGLLELELDLGNQCSSSCPFCPQSFDAVSELKPRFWRQDQILELLSSAGSGTRRIALSHAFESLQHPAIKSLLRRLREHDAPVELTTSGVGLDQEHLDAAREGGLARWILSIDGHDAGSFEAARRGDSFEALLERLELLRRESEREDGIPWIATTILRKTALPGLLSLLERCAAAGASEFRVTRLRPYYGLWQSDEVALADDVKGEALLSDLRSRGEALGVPVVIDPLPHGRRARRETTVPRSYIRRDQNEAPPPRRIVTRVRSEEAVALTSSIRGGRGSDTALTFEGGTVKSACELPFTRAIVRGTDHRVVPCEHWGDAEALGDLESESFEAIWNGAAWSRLRLEHQLRRFRPVCESCPRRLEN